MPSEAGRKHSTVQSVSSHIPSSIQQ